MSRSLFISFKVMVLLSSLTPSLGQAVPWKNLASSAAEVNSVCDAHGTLSRECMSALGLPTVLGKVVCLAANTEDPNRSYRLSWFQNADGKLVVTIGEAELHFPQAPGQPLPDAFFERSRVVGVTSQSDVQTPIPGHYLMAFKNTVTDVPGVVEGLPSEATVDLAVDSSNNPLGAVALGISFRCFSTAH